VGTGLGLSIVRQVCERLGGTIAMTSEEGSAPVSTSASRWRMRKRRRAFPLRPRVNKPPHMLQGLNQVLLGAERQALPEEPLCRAPDSEQVGGGMHSETGACQVEDRLPGNAVGG